MKALYTIIIVSAAALVLLGMMNFSPLHESGPVGSQPAAPTQLLSVAEVQQMICDMGYKIKVDGMLCQSCYAEGHSETQENWDRAYGDQTAIELWPEEQK